MFDILEFVKQWFVKFSELFQKLWHAIYDEDGELAGLMPDEEDA